MRQRQTEIINQTFDKKDGRIVLADMNTPFFKEMEQRMESKYYDEFGHGSMSLLVIIDMRSRNY